MIKYTDDILKPNPNREETSIFRRKYRFYNLTTNGFVFPERNSAAGSPAEVVAIAENELVHNAYKTTFSGPRVKSVQIVGEHNIERNGRVRLIDDNCKIFIDGREHTPEKDGQFVLLKDIHVSLDNAFNETLRNVSAPSR